MSLFPYPAVLDGMGGKGGREGDEHFVLKYLSVTANKVVGEKSLYSHLFLSSYP